MIKGYRVQIIRKDNRYGNTEKIVLERERSFPSCKNCYMDAYNALVALSACKETKYAEVGAVLVGDYADKRDRCPKIKELTHLSEYYTYLVTISCVD